METKPANPQAFPVDAGGTFQRGMSLRDYFANSAMQGLMSEYLSKGSNNGYWSDYDMIAKAAYRVADEMLTAREL